MTGSLDEEQLRQAEALLERLRALEDRRAAILVSIEEQGKLTDELRAAINAAETMTALEDLYAPYKPKRTTRASVARSKGLQPLADMILQQLRSPMTAEQHAEEFLNEQVGTVEEALAGARDIVAETISDHAGVRQETREKAMQWGTLQVSKIEDAEDPRRVYETYYEFDFRVDRLRPHQVLAINRGEQEKVLRVRLNVPERDWQNAIWAHFRPDPKSPFAEHMNLAVADAADRLLLPAIERDVRRALTETAEAHAIQVFASNLRALLNTPPLAGHTVLGIDPGFRTGCKVAVVDPTGKLLATETIYPHEPQKRWQEALSILRRLVEKHGVTLISIGNGTASRESEQLVAELLRDLPGVKYLITNEAGASVYSASPLARAELPDLDVSLRGAVSIARRVQDPLAELVKISRRYRRGMYRHDVDQGQLGKTLAGVVEDVVNRVGVDQNTTGAAGVRLGGTQTGRHRPTATNGLHHRTEHAGFPGWGEGLRAGKLPAHPRGQRWTPAPCGIHRRLQLLEKAGSRPATRPQRRAAVDRLLASTSLADLAELGVGSRPWRTSLGNWPRARPH